MAGHGKRQIGEFPEGREIHCRQFNFRGFSAGQAQVAIDAGTAMPWKMLHDRQDAAGQQALGGGAAKLGDKFRVLRKGPVADRMVEFPIPDIEERQAIDVDGEVMKLGGKEPGVQMAGLGATGGIKGRKPAEVSRRRLCTRYSSFSFRKSGCRRSPTRNPRRPILSS